jgi:hypothetical protein
MRLRTAAVTAMVAVAAAGTLAPALAAPPKPVEQKYTANATPDPTTTTPGGEICDPVTPTAKHSTEFKVPAAGTLKVELGNTLDWAIGIRVNGKLVASADGGTPEVKEVAVTKFKKATVVSVDVCNFAGEPSIPVTLTYTPAAKK